MCALKSAWHGRNSAGSQPAGLPWQRLYYLMVAFDVFTVSMSLYLNREIMQIYVRSVEVNQAWVERLHETARLNQLAGDVNAPGNDVFQSHQVEAESKTMRTALRAFNSQMETVRAELQTNVDASQAAQLLQGLQTAGQATLAMSAEAERLFEDLRSGKPTEAGKSMALMDRHYARVNQALERLRQDIGAIQQEHFAKQTAAAGTLQRFQYAIGTLILLMVAGAAVYGHKLRIITERNQAAQQRRLLLQKVIAAQEDERRRIARDLHDEIGQALTSLLIGLRTVAEATTLKTVQERSEDLRGITAATLEEVRRLAHGLRPSVLDDLGLIAALERQTADYAEAHGLKVELNAQGMAGERLPEEVETALYRIVQEALSNTARHAAAKHVSINVQRQAASVQVTIRDDGRGFDSTKANATGRLGLTGMRERASLLNGELVLEAQPGMGTTVTVRIPLENEDGQDARPDRG